MARFFDPQFLNSASFPTISFAMTLSEKLQQASSEEDVKDVPVQVSTRFFGCHWFCSRKEPFFLIY